MNRPTAFFLQGILASILTLVALACTGPTLQQPTPTPTPYLPPLTLPDDEAPHKFPVEWWYFNMLVEGPEKDRYAIHFVIFQLTETQSGRVMYVGQVGIADMIQQKHITAEEVITHNELPATVPGAFNLTVANWGMEGGKDGYLLSADLEGITFNLKLKPNQTVLLHSRDGLVDFGPAGVSYYYSRPRIDVTGTIIVDGINKPVKGLAWMDKQWGTFRPVTITWDWASIQLDSGTNLMLTRAVDQAGKIIEMYATVHRNGKTDLIEEHGFEFAAVPGHTWVSPLTDAAYPTKWQVSFPTHDIILELNALLPSSEYVGRVLNIPYWEGAMSVTGSEDGAPINGQAFVELTGRTPKSP